MGFARASISIYIVHIYIYMYMYLCMFTLARVCVLVSGSIHEHTLTTKKNDLNVREAAKPVPGALILEGHEAHDTALPVSNYSAFKT